MRKACSLFSGQENCSAEATVLGAPCCVAIRRESDLAPARHQVLASLGRTLTTPSREFFPLLNTLCPLPFQMLHSTDEASLCIPFELGWLGGVDQGSEPFQHRPPAISNCLAGGGWQITCYNQLCITLSRGNYYVATEENILCFWEV